MSYGLILSSFRRLSVCANIHQPRGVQARQLSLKKFLVPPSFQSHRKAKHARPKQQSGNHAGPSSIVRYTYEDTGVLGARVPPQLLDTEVERDLSQAAAVEFGLNTEPVLLQFCNQIHHPEISSFMKGYVSLEHMDTQAVKKLWHAMQNFLPEDPLNNPFMSSPRSKFTHLSYTCKSGSHASVQPGLKCCVNRMNMGWHLVMFNTPIFGRSLLFDGTDSRFVPGPPTVWRHRLWAGGSINLHRMFSEVLAEDRVFHQVESPVDVRVVGVRQVPEKIFVTVRKRFYRVDGKSHPQGYDLPGIVQYLKSGPKYDPQNMLTYPSGPRFEELYTLCFLRNPPNLSKAATQRRVVAPPIQPKFSHTLTPDRHLLFCWSALTHNAHRIHLDQAFAQKEYGAEDLIVHGPLTLLLILEWFHREITRYVLRRQLPRFHLKSIDYKVLVPTYVDEPMTLCTKPTRFQTPGTLADSWEVWVQKEVGNGQKTMTFRGTIKLRVEEDSHTTAYSASEAADHE